MNKDYYTNLSEEEFEKSIDFHNISAMHPELMNERLEMTKEIREKINSLIQSQDIQWAKERRAEFLNWKLLEVLEHKKELDLFRGFITKVFGGWQWVEDIFDKKVSIVEGVYTKYYKELAYLNRGDKKLDNNITEEMKEECRNVPIEDHIDTPLTNMGNGRKSTPCPVHQETKPSFVIYPDNSFHCFGCGLHGNNSIDFMTNVKNYTFMEAIKYLSN